LMGSILLKAMMFSCWGKSSNPSNSEPETTYQVQALGKRARTGEPWGRDTSVSSICTSVLAALATSLSFRHNLNFLQHGSRNKRTSSEAHEPHQATRSVAGRSSRINNVPRTLCKRSQSGKMRPFRAMDAVLSNERTLSPLHSGTRWYTAARTVNTEHDYFDTRNCRTSFPSVTEGP
jgi:hypothetical protein